MRLAPRITLLLCTLSLLGACTDRILVPREERSGVEFNNAGDDRASAPVDTIVVTPDSVTLEIGETIQLTAVAYDASGNIVPDAPISWSDSNIWIATVNQSGLVTAEGPGSTTIRAYSGSATTIVPITVNQGPDVTWASVTTGQGYSCGVTTDGRGFCWGNNGAGQLGIGIEGGWPKYIPTPVVGGITFSQIDGGRWHACGLAANGDAYCWGYGFHGQLGNGQVGSSGGLPTPQRVLGGHTFTKIDIGFDHGCGIVAPAASAPSATPVRRPAAVTVPTILLASQTGPPWESGTASVGGTGAPAAPTSLQARAVSDTQIDLQWTDNSGDETGFDVWRAQGGQYVRVARLGPNTTSYSDTGLQPSTTYTYGVLALNGYGYSGASNTASARTGSLAPPNPPSPFVPAAPSSLRAQAVSDTRIDLQWTDNSGDELGFDVWRAQGGQYVRVARLGPNATSYSDTGLQPSTNYIYGVVAYNAAGNSAPSNPTNATTHATPPPPPTGGAAYCWGNNTYGQLGNGSTLIVYGEPIPVPVVGDLTFIDISGGRDFTCGITTDERLYCWGNNQVGQLGDGASAPGLNVPYPVPVAGNHRWRAIATADSHACGVTTGGEAYCWGRDHFGELGLGYAGVTIDVPQRVTSNASFQDIGTGSSHTCAVAIDGTTHCWGYNRFGTLGRGTKGSISPNPIPEPVIGGVSFSGFVQGGYLHSCALGSNGRAYCWGTDFDGEAGIQPDDEFCAVPGGSASCHTRPKPVSNPAPSAARAIGVAPAATPSAAPAEVAPALGTELPRRRTRGPRPSAPSAGGTLRPR